jgi:hypothetical protein
LQAVKPKTKAAAPGTNRESSGAERDDRNVARNGASFKDPALSFLSDNACVALEVGTERVAKTVTAPPVLLSQRTSERWTSLPGRDFLAAARAVAFPSFKLRRLVMAKTSDVVSWIESHRVQRVANDADEWGTALARAGARRVGTR